MGCFGGWGFCACRSEAGGVWGRGSNRWPRWGLIAPTPGKVGLPELCVPSTMRPSAHLRQPRPRWLSWSWVRPERALLTEETVEAPRVMRMRPLSSKSAVLL